MKLISMREFVLEQANKLDPKESLVEFYQREISILKEIRDYAKFLSQPLTLGMFVPVDEDGNVLPKPKCQRCNSPVIDDCRSAKDCIIDENPFAKYNEAEKRVLFSGFKWVDYGEIIGTGGYAESNDGEDCIDEENIDSNTLEELIQFGYNLTLTQQAIKQIGG